MKSENNSTVVTKIERGTRGLSKILLDAIECSLDNLREARAWSAIGLWRRDSYHDDRSIRTGMIREGISFSSWRDGFKFEGRLPDILAAGLGAPHWFSDGRTPFGRKREKRFKRSLRLVVEGHYVETTTQKGDDFVSVTIYFNEVEKAALKRRVMRPAKLNLWDGNRLVRWSDCPWQPNSQPSDGKRSDDRGGRYD